ncbi:hypothetical protein [Stenotrophomonas sp.]|uniref:hypothetical protein n=1 Tax=Stenotrophomonas sp. TaxID=69392 RepID=UPI0028A82C3B|nr:hypothetical protein [Stenotrophomonas sp.]
MADLMQQAREFLAVAHENAGDPLSAEAVRKGWNPVPAVELAAITAALRAAPEAVALRTAMTTLEQIASAADDQGAKFNAMGALRFLQTQPVELSAAPDGFVLVPVEPTREMMDAGRAAVMAEHCASPKWTPRQHYKASGLPTTGIPHDVLDEHGPLTKESVAVMVYGTMLAARPQGVKDA